MIDPNEATRTLSISALFDLRETLAAKLFEGIIYPWEALNGIAQCVRALGAMLPADEYEARDGDIWIARDANVYPSAYIAGPAIIGHGAQIRHGAFIRGSALVGAHAVVGNSTELKNAILFNGAQAPHFNYIGDSILGHGAHMGAGSITSNVKSDKRNIIVRAGDERLETGLRKFGAMVGDFAEIGCNAVLNPGSVIGRHAIVYPTSSVRGVVPGYTIHKQDGTRVERRREGIH